MAIATIGTHAASDFRGEDDAVNYGIGGFLGGAFLGLQKKSIHAVIVSAITLGATAAFSGAWYENSLANEPIQAEVNKTVKKLKEGERQTL